MKVVWTKRAYNRLAEISEYIENEFGEIAKNSFQSKTQNFTKLLIEFPELGTIEVAERIYVDFNLPNKQKCFIELSKIEY